MPVPVTADQDQLVGGDRFCSWLSGDSPEGSSQISSESAPALVHPEKLDARFTLVAAPAIVGPGQDDTQDQPTGPESTGTLGG